MFQVIDGIDTLTVNLEARTCTCRKWDLTGIPCFHVVAVIFSVHGHAEDYVSDYYKREAYLRSYNLGIAPVPGQRHWIEMTCSICKSNTHNKRKRPDKNKTQPAPPKNPMGRPRKYPRLEDSSELAAQPHYSATAQPSRVGRGGRVTMAGRFSGRNGGRRGRSASRNGGRARAPQGFRVLFDGQGNAFTNVTVVKKKGSVINKTKQVAPTTEITCCYSINVELSGSSGFDSSRVLFLASLWLFPQAGVGIGGDGDGDGGGDDRVSMDLSKVGEKILSSVRSARSLGLFPSTSDRPEVPARAAAAAAVARALATLTPEQRQSLQSSSAELSSIYGSRPNIPTVEELEEEFYEEEFDPVMYVLNHIPSEEDELEHYENKATVRLAQLDAISARLSRHVMEHHEEMVKGMQLVRELERDLKIATVICMNGRRHLTSSMHEVSRDLIVTANSKKKQTLLDFQIHQPGVVYLQWELWKSTCGIQSVLDSIEIPFSKPFVFQIFVLGGRSRRISTGSEVVVSVVLARKIMGPIPYGGVKKGVVGGGWWWLWGLEEESEGKSDLLPALSELCHAQNMQKELETLLEEGNFSKAFQVLSEFLQLLDTFSELSAAQEMSRSVEVWLGNALQKLDSLLVQVCQVFKEEKYVTVIDAYALIGDVSGLAEKIQSFFMQEVLSETHATVKTAVQEVMVVKKIEMGIIVLENVKLPKYINACLPFLNKALPVQDQDTDNSDNSSRLTYSDLCLQLPESKFRNCLSSTLAVLFSLMCSYYAIMSFQPENELNIFRFSYDKGLLVKLRLQDCLGIVDYQCPDSRIDLGETIQANVISPKLEEVQETSVEQRADNGSTDRLECGSSVVESANEFSATVMSCEIKDQLLCDGTTSSSGSPWYELRRDATLLISQSLQRGRKNLWQLVTSRVSVLLASSAFCSASIHQFLRNYEDLNIFVLAGEAFCGLEAAEFAKKLKVACESYYSNFHKQNIYIYYRLKILSYVNASLLEGMVEEYEALKMVLEKESWQKLPSDAVQVVAFAGLVGDGAPLMASSDSSTNPLLLPNKSIYAAEMGSKNSGFSHWLNCGNPFLLKFTSPAACHTSSPCADGPSVSGGSNGTPIDFQSNKLSTTQDNNTHENGETDILDDENEDLLADFIDEDSQLPSRISKSSLRRNQTSQWKDDESSAQTGSSLCLLRFMDKYARLMQKLGMINVELFKGLCHLFEMYYYFVFETFGRQDNSANGKGVADSLNYRLKSAMNRAMQDCEQWLRPPQLLTSSSSLPASFNTSFKNMELTPTTPLGTNSAHFPGTFDLKERCVAVNTIYLVARVLHRSKPHLQSMLLQNNPVIVEDFFVNLVDTVPDLIEHIHRTTAKSLLHIIGYIDRIANAKWEVKELGMEHNGYVDLLLGEFKHYTTRLAHAGIQKEVQDLLLEYGVEIVAETLVEGLSRIKRCTDEGRALMSLDLQVLINGLQHFIPKDVKPKFQIVETFIKAYYLPETEYVHWARAHPEYSKSQIIGLVNLVATMKGWKRKTRLETLEKIESS
ncbi:hypothetical protein KSS87_018864 [Heliosperma pusillum]|nr:hypothetical protein KSS87_018864 [Heliosperma pusillum]